MRDWRRRPGALVAGDDGGNKLIALLVGGIGVLIAMSTVVCLALNALAGLPGLR